MWCRKPMVVAALALLVPSCSGDDAASDDPQTSTSAEAAPLPPPEPREPSVELTDEGGQRFRLWAEEPLVVPETTEGVPPGYATVVGRYVLQNLQDQPAALPARAGDVVLAVTDRLWADAYKIGNAAAADQCVTDGVPAGFCRLPADLRTEQGFDPAVVRIDDTLRVDLLVGDVFLPDEVEAVEVNQYYVGGEDPVRLWPPGLG